jgi:hypothetical protein
MFAFAGGPFMSRKEVSEGIPLVRLSNHLSIERVSIVGLVQRETL